MSTFHQVLLEGLEGILDPEEFDRRSWQLINAAMDKVLSDALKNKLNRRRTAKGLRGFHQYVTEATITNAKGNHVQVPVFFEVDPTATGDRYIAYLHVGGYGAEGHCTGGDPRMSELARKIFRITLKLETYGPDGAKAG